MKEGRQRLFGSFSIIHPFWREGPPNSPVMYFLLMMGLSLYRKKCKSPHLNLKKKQVIDTVSELSGASCPGSKRQQRMKRLPLCQKITNFPNVPRFLPSKQLKHFFQSHVFIGLLRGIQPSGLWRSTFRMAVLWRRSSKARHMWLQTKLLLPPPQRGLVSMLLLEQSWLRWRRRCRDPQAAVPVSPPPPPRSSPRPCTCSTTFRGCLPSPIPHSGLCHQHIFLGWDRPQNRQTWFGLLQMWTGPIYCHIFCVMSLT